MSRNFVSANNQWLSLPFTLSAYPITVGCWFKDDIGTATGNDRCMMQISDVSEQDYFRLGRLDGANNQVNFFSFDGTNSLDTLCTTQYTNNTWNHALGVVETASRQSVYMNGTDVVTDTSGTLNTPAGHDQLAIGLENDATQADPWSGELADCFVYKGAIPTAAQITALAAGVSPASLFAAADLCFISFSTDSIIATGGWNNGTMTDESTTGSTTYAVTHPPVTIPVALGPIW